MWLVGEEDRTWPVLTSREPGEYADDLRVIRWPDTATAVQWFRRRAKGDYTAEPAVLYAATTSPARAPRTSPAEPTSCSSWRTLPAHCRCTSMARPGTALRSTVRRDCVRDRSPAYESVDHNPDADVRDLTRRSTRRHASLSWLPLPFILSFDLFATTRSSVDNPVPTP